MSLLILFQVALDLGLIAVATLLLIERVRSRNQDDPRLTRGLQILTSKIAVLQDLLDRSETATRQMQQLLDRKNQDIQERVEEVELYLQKLKSSMEKSQEIAKIFQDKIPHQEIIERQNTAKYIQAAKLANQGITTDEIAKQLEIPRGELDLIVKLNRERLVVDKDPVWLDSAVEMKSEQTNTLFAPAPAPAPSSVRVTDGIVPVEFRKISFTDGLG